MCFEAAKEIKITHFVNLWDIVNVDRNEKHRSCMLRLEWSLHQDTFCSYTVCKVCKVYSCIYIERWLMQRVLLRPQDPDSVIWSSLGGDHLEMSIKGKDWITFHDLRLCVLVFWEINSLILSMLLSESLFVMDKLSLTFLYNQNNMDSRRSQIICIIKIFL